MQPSDRTIWLEAQLAEVDRFIERDTARLDASPNSFSLQLSLDSWHQHRQELLDELLDELSAPNGSDQDSSKKSVNLWFYKHMPVVWGRWFAARLMATTACSEWLHEGNQEFTGWQRLKRNALCLALFLKPGKLTLTITKKTAV